ncbi:phosphoinositide-3-kinase-interacting protein 1-like isoform X3 [Narcine bancroftii]|uniref:phosphoinositide-3-kinase-interacting protein 1-like isoform X3 n=1 Tax=Narcine bancroftii TaxID=1343680 RepID=UPI0038319952
MQHRGCLQVAMDAVVGRRGSGQGSGVAVPALKQVALLLHLLIVVGAAPRPDCATGNTTGFRGERHITPAVGCTNLVETKLNFNLTLSHSNVTGASQDKDLDQTMGEPAPVKPAESVPQVDDQVTSDAQQSAGGSSTTARQSTKRKKDLGVLGQVLAIGMIVIIILLGSGIAVGYVCKRGHDLKKQQEQRACEREIQRIMLPLSAFSNPGCELDDEVTVVMVSPQTQTGENEAGASTPGA